MANTESLRAKSPSQSAPQQRLSVSSATDAGAGADGEAACSWERQASAPGACPWGDARLDRWSASAHDSECGSSSTIMTAATTTYTYCWSLATDNAAGMA
ncbi:unnamed protein product [Urochloa humidicola]